MILLNAQLDTISLNDNIKWNFSHTDIIINKHTQTYYIVKPVLRIPGKTNLTARDVTATYEPQIHYFERDLTDAILLENIKVYNLKRIIDPKQGRGWSNLESKPSFSNSTAVLAWDYASFVHEKSRIFRKVSTHCSTNN